MNFYTFYVILINILSFSFCVYDKICAIKNKWRISERFLLFLSLIGGGIGMLFGMFLVRHKINKPKFLIGIPCIIFIEFLIVNGILQKILKN